MNQLPEHISLQIEKDANDYADAMKDKYDQDYESQLRKTGYSCGAEIYALKWQQAEEMMEKMAKSLKTVVNNWDDAKLNAIRRDKKVYDDNVDIKIAKELLTEYNNYKQTNNVTE